MLLLFFPIDRYCKRVVHLLKQMTLISELASLSVDSQFRKFSENVTSLYGSMHLSPVSHSNRNETRSGTETCNQMDDSLEEWQEPSGRFEKKVSLPALSKIIRLFFLLTVFITFTISP